MEPFKTIPNHSEPFRTIPNHFIPFRIWLPTWLILVAKTRLGGARNPPGSVQNRGKMELGSEDTVNNRKRTVNNFDKIAWRAEGRQNGDPGAPKGRPRGNTSGHKEAQACVKVAKRRPKRTPQRRSKTNFRSLSGDQGEFLEASWAPKSTKIEETSRMIFNEL